MRNIFILLFALFCYANCLAQIPLSLYEDGHNYGKTELEKEWFSSIDTANAQLDYDGYFINDDTISTYLYSILDKIIPTELKDFSINIHVLKSPNINAGMYPNGTMIINSGILTTYNNEAQLAYTMCHELAHFVYRHSLLDAYKTIELYEDKSWFIYSKTFKEKRVKEYEYSRQLESEADSLGLILYLNADYPPVEAVNSMGKLPSTKSFKIPKFLQFLLGILPPLPTHPKNEERVQFLTKRTEKLPHSGQNFEKKYQHITFPLIEKNIQLMKEQSNPFKLIGYIDTLMNSIEDKNSTYYKTLLLTKGETYQSIICNPTTTAMHQLMDLDSVPKIHLSLKKGNELYKVNKEMYIKKSFLALDQLIDDNEVGFKAHRAKAMIYFYEEQYELAEKHFKLYIKTEEPITDRRYIKSKLKKIKQLKDE